MKISFFIYSICECLVHVIQRPRVGQFLCYVLYISDYIHYTENL